MNVFIDLCYDSLIMKNSLNKSKKFKSKMNNTRVK